MNKSLLIKLRILAFLFAGLDLIGWIILIINNKW